MLNKKENKNQFTESSGPFSLIPNPGSDHFEGAEKAVSLSLFKVGLLGCVAMDVASPYTDSFGGKSVQGVGAQAFLGGMR
jgi:hypothetical protein